MDHGPAVEYEESEDIIKYKSRIGIILFFIYAAIYAAFVTLNTILPKSMKLHVLLGLNLAIFYGFSLIILAIIMGLIYNSICNRKERGAESLQGEDKK